MTDVKIEGESGGHSHGGAAATPEDKFFEDHKLFINKLVLYY